MLVFRYGGEIEIGDHCYIGEDTRIWSGEKISIGNNVLIGHNVNIVDFSHEPGHQERADSFKKLITEGHPRVKGNFPTAPAEIEDHVEIYPYAQVARGVRLGRGAEISADSVVISYVPPFTLVMGNRRGK